MLQGLLIALAQIEVGNNPENLCTNQKKLLQKYTKTQLNQNKYKNG